MSNVKLYQPRNFKRSDYKAREVEMMLHSSQFFLILFRDVYRIFKGDLAESILLIEIAHHSVSRLFSASGIDEPALRTLFSEAGSRHRERYLSCNAYSLSLSTGIPRETVRRKLKAMAKKGYIVYQPRTGAQISADVQVRISPEYQMRHIDCMLDCARRIDGLLNGARTVVAKAAKE